MDDELVGRAESFWTEYLRAEYRAWAGLEEAPALERVLRRYADLFDAGAIEELAQAIDRAEGGEALRLRHLREFLLWGRADRAAAPALDERLAWEAAKTLRAGEVSIPFRQAGVALGNEPSAERRWAIDDARLAALREAEPLDRRRFEADWDVFEAAGGDYLAVWEAATGIALDPLVAAVRSLLGDTAELHRDLLGYELEKRLALEPAGARLADVRRLERAPWFDAWFAGSDPAAAARRQLGELGFDLEAGGRIRLDLEAREAKRARAFCSPIRVPDEVVLVITPSGGWRDWSSFYHELGHAQHFAGADAGLPFAFRALGDISVTEAYARLFQRLPAHPLWLERYLGLSGAERADFLRLATLLDLFHLRRQAGKLLYEIELHGDRRFEGMPDRYAERLTEATSLRHDRAAYLDDVDPRLYCTRYLRAWALETLLVDVLRDRFDEDWFRNPRAGPFLADLFSLGQAEGADALARRLGGELDFRLVARRLEEAV